MQILLTNKGTLSGSCHSYAKGAVILGGGGIEPEVCVLWVF